MASSTTQPLSHDACAPRETQRNIGAHKAGAQGNLSAPVHDAWRALLRSHAALIERVSKHLSGSDSVPIDWYDVLLALSYAPKNRLKMGELVEFVTLSRSGLTRLVDRLENAGLVKRELGVRDRRSFECVLTPAGEAALKKTWPLYAEAIAAIVGRNLSEEEAMQLANLLGKAAST